MQPDNRVACTIGVPSGTVQSTKPPPNGRRTELLLFADLDQMMLRWATGGEAKEKLLRNLGGLLFSLLLVGTLHIAIALTE